MSSHMLKLLHSLDALLGSGLIRDSGRGETESVQLGPRLPLLPTTTARRLPPPTRLPAAAACCVSLAQTCVTQVAGLPITAATAQSSQPAAQCKRVNQQALLSTTSSGAARRTSLPTDPPTAGGAADSSTDYTCWSKRASVQSIRVRRPHS